MLTILRKGNVSTICFIQKKVNPRVKYYYQYLDMMGSVIIPYIQYCSLWRIMYPCLVASRFAIFLDSLILVDLITWAPKDLAESSDFSVLHKRWCLPVHYEKTPQQRR